jgi:hypothetical protein
MGRFFENVGPPEKIKFHIWDHQDLMIEINTIAGIVRFWVP